MAAIAPRGNRLRKLDFGCCLKALPKARGAALASLLKKRAIPIPIPISKSKQEGELEKEADDSKQKPKVFEGGCCTL